ncbi:hypothetical protein [Humibacillus xanthopallidus]|nr:hypothetical protein [Humibacillus xanthopallidus]
MTTSTLPTRATAARVDSPVASRHPAVAADRVPQLALVAPLLLFTHGILAWVDGIGAADPTETQGSVLAIVAGGILVLAVAGFASLAGMLAARSGRSEIAVPVALLSAFGAGAAAAVWVLRSTGWLVDPLPSGLTTGGAVVTALALGLALVVHTAEGRMPSGSLALAGGAGALLALPLGLEPLGALVLLIALAPLTRPVQERRPAA